MSMFFVLRGGVPRRERYLGLYLFSLFASRNENVILTLPRHAWCRTFIRVRPPSIGGQQPCVHSAAQLFTDRFVVR